MSEDQKDQFDNLFEPFGLTGEPDDTRPEPTAPGQEPIPQQPPGGAQVYCAACGTPNPAANHHCEMCGARLQRTHTPVAPQPMLRTTAGARALVVLSAIVLGVALLALVINVFGSDEPVASDVTAATVTTLAAEPIGLLTPIRVDCSSELTGFPCQALIDGDSETSWNADPDVAIVGAELTFFFSPPVQLTEVFFVNLQDEERFTRNSRIRGITIEIDDLAQATFDELDDTNEDPQRIQIRSLRTSSMTITITSAYPGSAFEGKEAFRELALERIEFYGRVAPEPSGTP